MSFITIKDNYGFKITKDVLTKLKELLESEEYDIFKNSSTFTFTNGMKVEVINMYDVQWRVIANFGKYKVDELFFIPPTNKDIELSTILLKVYKNLARAVGEDNG